MPLDVELDVSGRGRSIREIMAGLNGAVDVEVGSGTIQSVWAGIAMADLDKLLVPGSSSATVNCIVADFSVDSGIAKPNELVVDTPSLSLFGSGRIDLRNEELGLRFDRHARGLSASGALPPFKIGGTLASPKAARDPLALAGSTLDLGVGILMGEPNAVDPQGRDATPASCRSLHESYVRARTSRKPTPATAIKVIDSLLEDGGKSALGRLKGLLNR